MAAVRIPRLALMVRMRMRMRRMRETRVRRMATATPTSLGAAALVALAVAAVAQSWRRWRSQLGVSYATLSHRQCTTHGVGNGAYRWVC
jgi:hypothetical protein